MPKLFLIDDDVVTTKIFAEMFKSEGFEVEVAADGEAALANVVNARPDIILLDLMLPKIHGIEVLKRIRSESATRTVPVIVFTNAYLASMVKAAWKAGANMSLTKANCTPEKLLDAVRTVMSNAPVTPPPGLEDIPGGPAGTPVEGIAPAASVPVPTFGSLPTPLAAVVPAASATAPVRMTMESQPVPTPVEATESLVLAGNPPEQAASTISRPAATLEPAPPVAREPMETQGRAAIPSAPLEQAAKPEPAVLPPIPKFQPRPEPMSTPQSKPSVAAAPAANSSKSAKSGSSSAHTWYAEIRQKFQAECPATSVALRNWVPMTAKNKKPSDWMPQLYQLHQMINPLPGHAGIAGFDKISQMSSALQALLEGLFEEPEHLNQSTFRTVTRSVETLASMFQKPTETHQPVVNILVIDDEPLARRTVCAALELANLKPISLQDPLVALTVLQENEFDLIFLDVDMPEMNGFEVCSRIRELPSNKTTPVIFTTVLSDFDSRARSTLSGGSDLIAKPYLLIELAVKALTYIFKKQLTGSTPE